MASHSVSSAHTTAIGRADLSCWRWGLREELKSRVEREDNEWASAGIYYEQLVVMVNGRTIAE
jgi:hypothetical protein